MSISEVRASLVSVVLIISIGVTVGAGASKRSIDNINQCHCPWRFAFGVKEYRCQEYWCQEYRTVSIEMQSASEFGVGGIGGVCGVGGKYQKYQSAM